MDIWAWVHELVDDLYAAGDDDLADLIVGLPAMALNDDVARLAAAVPQLLAESRARGLPWLAVYARHWELQGRAAHHGEGKAALTAAIEALDLSHAQEARGCPQAVCTVQDICIAYGNADGPGYAAERLAVTEEIFERIDLTWPCFTCITEERAAALVDDGQPQEALDFLAGRQPLLAPDEYPDDRFLFDRVRAALMLQRPDEALRAVEAAERRPSQNHGAARVYERSLQRAKVLVALGRGDEARAVLPTPDVLPPRARADWAETAAGLVQLEALDNDAELSATLRGWIAERLEAGAFRAALAICGAAVDLAAARGARWAAAQAATQAGVAAAGLRDPATAAETVARLVATADAVAPPDLPADGARSDLPDQGTVDEEVDVWLAGVQRWPADEDVVLGAAARLAHLGDLDEARRLAADYVVAHPDAEHAPFFLVEVALDQGPQACAEVAEELDARAPEAATWLRARWAYRESRLDDCVALCRRLIELWPQRVSPRRLLAQAAIDGGDHEQALDLTEQVIDILGAEADDAIEDHWWRIVAATILGRWNAVRESCRYLELEVESEDGPIDEAWHMVLISYEDGSDEYALRTGPVTARVRSVAAPGQTQRADDLLVFHPALESPPPEEEDPDWIAVHRHLLTLEAGECTSYTVLGVGDDEEQLRRAVDAVADTGARLWIVSAPTTWFDPDGEEVAGFAARAAVPPDVDVAAVHEALVEVYGATPVPEQPVLWPEVAAAADDADAAAAHAEQWDRWRF